MADSKDITLKIDDREVTVPPGTLVIEAARRMGIEVPSFCYFPGLSLQAACRMCLVEVEKAPKLQTACTLVAMPGMVVRTSTPQVHEARKGMLGRTFCPLGDAAAMPTISIVKKWRHEFEEHLSGKCPHKPADVMAGVR